jgi:hypothetical protein
MRNPLATALALTAAIAILAFTAAPARADLAPPDSCTSPGQPCQNAGPQHDASGTCIGATCTKQVPAPDGGTMTMSYDCNRCQPGSGGAGGDGAGGGGGSAGAAGGGAGSGGTGGSSPPSSKSSGCSVAAAGRDGAGGAGALLLIATLVLTSGRRRTSVR